MWRRTAVLLVIVLFIFGLHTAIKHSEKTSHSAASPDSTSVLGATTALMGQRTKSSNCQVVNALPDHACTPGASSASLTKTVLCDPTFSTKTVRNVPAQEKDEVYKEYGILTHAPGQYEVDHLISLELGGSNDIANLWPEAAEPRPGFHEKDTVENSLHQQVCNGSISLESAQQQIANNWLLLYKP